MFKYYSDEFHTSNRSHIFHGLQICNISLNHAVYTLQFTDSIMTNIFLLLVSLQKALHLCIYTILSFISYLYTSRFVQFLFTCDASANVHVVRRLCVVHHCWGWWSQLVQNGQLCSQCFVYLLQSS